MDLTPKRDEVIDNYVDISDEADNEHISSIAEAVGHLYKGKIIQVYWSEAGGSTNYADFIVHQNMFIEGRVLWGRGDVFALECDYQKGGKVYKKQVLLNAWSATMIALKDGVDLDILFKNRGFNQR